MVSPTTLLHIPPLEPPTPHPFTSTSPSSRAPLPSRPPAQLQPRMQPAHRARCAMQSSSWCQGLDMDTRPGPQGDRALPVRIQPTDTTPLMETHPRRTVGTKSSIGERRGLAISGQKDQKQLLSVWLCKISESVLIELRKTIFPDADRCQHNRFSPGLNDRGQNQKVSENNAEGAQGFATRRTARSVPVSRETVSDQADRHLSPVGHRTRLN
ncbi:hypothetical protein JB92DRAFT_3092090 [Gautieria morchelliformis]|nr:hypothetical protein JB92DRAFT_3092090 [Gautieria morchelliformis]